MDRRKALKNMSLAMGYAVATPTLVGIIQSCKGESVLEWTPDFFSKDQGIALTKLVDIILPKTDTPAASEVQVHLFIDRFINEVVDAKEQSFIKMIANTFMTISAKDNGKENVSDLGSEALEKTLASFLQISKEDELKNAEELTAYFETIENGAAAILDESVAASTFASKLRDMTIMGYRTSEYVGENVLAYDPLPGPYVACGNLEELTGGKAWSL